MALRHQEHHQRLATAALEVQGKLRTSQVRGRFVYVSHNLETESGKEVCDAPISHSSWLQGWNYCLTLA